MPNYLTDDAICLRVTDFSETSQIVGVFTRHHGLLPLIAKGAKRSSKKNTMSGPLDLLTGGEIVFIPPKGAAELGTLTAWELVDNRNGLRTDFAALNAAMLAAEITTLLVHPHDPHEALFEELEATLELLGTAQRTRVIVAYAKAGLEAAGYAPQLDACLVCGKPITSDAPVRFSTRAGGMLCGLAAQGGGASCAAQGATITVPGRIAAALHRLPAPRVLRETMPERPADAAALLTAMQLLLAQIESIADKPVRTRYLLPSLFGVRSTPSSPQS